MRNWNIKFIIQKIRSDERINHKKEVIKNETVVTLEIDNIDLDIILKCNDPYKTKFSYDKLFQRDKMNISNDEITEDMIKEYYVNNWELNFSERNGIVNLNYPKTNIL